MNLLLLLSALLSALGGLGGARAQAAPTAVCACPAQQEAPFARSATQAVRPPLLVTGLADVAAAPAAVRYLVPAAEPFFMGRRRE